MSRKLWIKTCVLLLTGLTLVQLPQVVLAGDDEVNVFFRGCRGNVEVDD